MAIDLWQKSKLPPLLRRETRSLPLVRDWGGVRYIYARGLMCFNRLLKRTGHFWEKRYFCDGFPASDRERALNTLRYIHGNPKAAKIRHSFFYDFSNYGSYERLTNDGLTQWHPTFLRLGSTLEECAKKYKGFCQKYKPKEKNPSKCHWGSRLLAGVHLTNTCETTNPKKKSRFPSSVPCQVSENEELTRVVRQFIQSNRAVNEEGKEF